MFIMFCLCYSLSKFHALSLAVIEGHHLQKGIRDLTPKQPLHVTDIKKSGKISKCLENIVDNIIILLHCSSLEVPSQMKVAYTA